MRRVLLIDMPFAEVRYPSLALGLFKSALERERIACDVEYLNCLFASMVGWESYTWLASQSALLAGERLFARVFFGPDVPPDREYYQHISTYLNSAEQRDLQRMAETVVPFLQTCLANIRWQAYDVVGFTSMFEQNVASLSLAYHVKRRFPEITIVMGGANCEDIMGRTLQQCFPFIDHVFTGESDDSFPDLVKRLALGDKSASNVSEAPVDLDSLPVPDYSDYFRALRQYRAPEWLHPAVLMETSRGCWWGEKVKCTFCGLNGGNVRFRRKCDERIKSEIAELVRRYGSPYIRMVDNILDPALFDSLLPELADLNPGVRFFFEARSNLRKEQVKMLASAGVSDVQIGVENLSTHALKLMRKGVSALAAVQTLKWCKQYGVYADWNIIYGFPGEQPADYARNLEVARLITHLSPPAGVGPFRMDRFSTNFDEADQMGFTQVRPHPIYRFVYPFSESTLRDLVYFFDYEYQTRIDDGGYLELLQAEVRAWKARQDQLSSSPVGEDLVIYDTRRAAGEVQRRVRGLQRRVLEECDRASTVEQLGARLPDASSQAIQSTLDELLRANLLIEEGKRYLSLPLMPHRD